MGVAGQLSCEKFVEINDPIDTITTNQQFSTDQQARTAMAAVYSILINDMKGEGAWLGQFGNGMTSLFGGLSSDELNVRIGPSSSLYVLTTNRLFAENTGIKPLWTTAYKTIYNANAVLEGIETATSNLLTQDARKQMTGEAKFIRAFTYFYLVNFFGDVPLALSIDFNKTQVLPRAPKEAVYRQIIEDLLAAQSLLAPNNPLSATDERIIPDKWAATALLARVYLFTGDNTNAAKQAGDVIGNTARYALETDLNRVFLKDSKEAIWQLKQSINHSARGNATPEGYGFIPASAPGEPAFYNIPFPLTDQLLNAFDADDKRRINWVGRSSYTSPTAPGPFYFPYKYKIGANNRAVNVAATEYSMGLRLAEQYLIRAEALARGGGSLPDAIGALNVIRRRAGLTDLPNDLTQSQIMAAVAQERRVELFAEGGHRWLDLKRTGEARNVLSLLPLKQPWPGDYQLLYPIPVEEIQAAPNLHQNPGY